MERKDALGPLFDLRQESWWGTHKTSVINSDDQLKWYENQSSNQLYLVGEWTLEQAENTVVGVMGYTEIDTISRSLKISGAVCRSCRSPLIVQSGSAAGLDFAFEMLNMQRVEAEVLACNIPAQRIEFDYLGFTIEGCKRKAIYKCGTYYDSIVLGILREEWENQPRVKSYGGSCNETFNRSIMDVIAERVKSKYQIDFGHSPMSGSNPDDLKKSTTSDVDQNSNIDTSCSVVD